MRIEVTGEPAPQGSKRHVGGGVMIESSKKVKPWRQDVIAAAVAAMEDQPGWAPPAAAAVRVVFRLRRPASVSPRRRPRPNVKPDLDKLLRATLDALTIAGALGDDAHVVVLVGRKVYADAGESTGARVVILPA